METKAILRGVRLSEQKGRLVADLVRGKSVEQALNILTFSPKKGAKIIKKVNISPQSILRSPFFLWVWSFEVYKVSQII